jgi:hypothetical protein
MIGSRNRERVRRTDNRHGTDLYRRASRIFEEFQQPAIQTKIVQHSGGFFHQIKMGQRIGSKDSSIQAACRRMRRLETFLY